MSAAAWGYYATHLGHVRDGHPKRSHHSSLRALAREGLLTRSGAAWRLTEAGARVLAEADAQVRAGNGGRTAVVSS